MKKNFIILLIPFIIGSVCALALYYPLKSGFYIYRLDFVLNAIITCAAAFSGFILTSLSILIGLSSSPIMRQIASDGGLPELRCRYTESIVVGLFLIIFCVFLGGITNQENIISIEWSLSGIVLLVSYLISTIATVFYLLSIIGKIPSKGVPKIVKNPSTPKGDFQLNKPQDNN